MTRPWAGQTKNFGLIPYEARGFPCRQNVLIGSGVHHASYPSTSGKAAGACIWPLNCILYLDLEWGQIYLHFPTPLRGVHRNNFTFTRFLSSSENHWKYKECIEQPHIMSPDKRSFEFVLDSVWNWEARPAWKQTSNCLLEARLCLLLLRSNLNVNYSSTKIKNYVLQLPANVIVTLISN